MAINTIKILSAQKNRKNQYAIYLLIGLFLVACGNDQQEKRDVTQKIDIPEVNIAILDDRCEPMTLKVQAGKTRFVILNKSTKTVEWEILEGLRIIDERENILPSFTQKMTVYLDPGRYEMACGLLSNPRGALIVEAKNNITTRLPTKIELVGAQAEYNVYLHTELSMFIKGVNELEHTLIQNDLLKSQQQYLSLWESYAHLSPFLAKTPSADVLLQSLLTMAEALFIETSTQNLVEQAQRLSKRSSEALTQLSALEISAQRMIDDMQVMINNATTTSQFLIENATFEDSVLNVQHIRASVDSASRIFRLVDSMLKRAQPSLEEEIAQQLETLKESLAMDKELDQNLSAIWSEKAQINALQTQLKALEAKLKQLPQALGI